MHPNSKARRKAVHSFLRCLRRRQLIAAADICRRGMNRAVRLIGHASLLAAEVELRVVGMADRPQATAHIGGEGIRRRLERWLAWATCPRQRYSKPIAFADHHVFGDRAM